jgi:hypothetical protein
MNLPPIQSVVEMLKSANISFDTQNIKEVYHDQASLFPILANASNSNANLFAGWLFINNNFCDLVSTILAGMGVHTITPLLGKYCFQCHAYIVPATSPASELVHETSFFVMFTKLGSIRTVGTYNVDTAGQWNDVVLKINAYNAGAASENLKIQNLLRFYGYQTKVQDGGL